MTYRMTIFIEVSDNGIPSYVMIHDDGSEMAVYANHGPYPDPGYQFTLSPLFEKPE